jgi:Ca2+-binding EF-hand superfamily protein
LFDADDDGFVDYQELKQTVGEILYILDKEQMEERVDAMLYFVFEYADTNQDEMLDLDEFLAIFEEKNGFHIRSAEQMHMDMDTIKIVAKRMVGNDWTN